MYHRPSGAGAFVRGMHGQALRRRLAELLERIGSDMIGARSKLLNAPPEICEERGVVMQAWARVLS